MGREFRLPDLGEGVHEGQVVRVLVAEGDEVTEDQPLMEVETDKAAVEIPSPQAGVIEKVHVQEQQMVNVGEVMVTYAESASAVGGSAAQRKKKKSAAGAGERVTGGESGGGTATAAPPSRSAGRHKPASPAVRKLAKSLGVDLDSIEGSGPGGRVTREDVEHAAKSGSTPASPSTTSAPAARTAPSRPVPPSTPAPRRPAAQPAELPDGDDAEDQYGPVRRVAITQARKTIARVMSESKATIPHVTDTNDADVTDLDKLRRDYNRDAEAAGRPKLTMLPFLIRALARALRVFPEFNASFDAENDRIIYRKYINIAVGVHTERGLVAPVIRDADQLGIAELADRLHEIAEKARTASFAVNDTRGGTYTVSNPGAVGRSRYSTPIVTPPQVAVLAMGRSRWMPWVVDERIVPRLIMPLSHSFDHRLIDGGREVEFMEHLVGDLENPGRLVL